MRHPLIVSVLAAVALALSRPTPVLSQTNTIPASGNVGIGTLSPSTLLQIDSSSVATLLRLSSYAPGIEFQDNVSMGSRTMLGGIGLGTFSGSYGGGPGDLNIFTASYAPGNSNAIRFVTASNDASAYAERMRITRDGNVGIGTANPSYLLTLAGAGDSPMVSLASSTNGVEAFFQAAGYEEALHFGTISNHPIRLFTDNQERVRIDASGNVGIGTASPESKVQVNTAADSIDGVGLVGGDNHSLALRPSSGSGMANGIVQAGDGAIIYSGGLQGSGAFVIAPWAAATSGFRMDSNGDVGIDTTSPTYPLTVNGTIRAKEVIVDTGWADYVFEPSYHLMPLTEEAAYIRKHRHLPGIPTAPEVKTDGVSVGEIQVKLLEKIEELTLRAIEQERRLSKQDRQLAEQAAELSAQQNEIRGLRMEMARASAANRP